MARTRNTNASGGPFSEATRLKVWEKASKIYGKAHEGHFLRKDRYGNTIRWSKYGQTTEQGWEIDHIRPVAEGGTDHLNNLQPLQWRENRRKGDKWPYSK